MTYAGKMHIKNFNKPNNYMVQLMLILKYGQNICYSKVQYAIKESKSTIKLPNGCCVSNDYFINCLLKNYLKIDIKQM